MSEMNEKQKAILEALVRLEFALNGLVRDAQEEKLPIRLMVVANRFSVSVDQAQYQLQNLMDA